MQDKKAFRLAGVMGWPIGHSRSPTMHNYWIAQNKIPAYYAPLAVEPRRLESALRGLAALSFAGVNLTIPLKESALTIVDRLTPDAQKIGAVNCVRVEADDSLTGCNFDAFGFIASIREAAPKWRAAQGPVAMLGAGGAARAILYGLIEDGAKDIRILNRTHARARGLAEEFCAYQSACVLTPVDWRDGNAALQDAALLVNATSQGMTGQAPLEIALEALPQNAIVADIVYAPLETPLLAAARRRGNLAINGLGMLIHQARPAFEAWFGVLPEATPELQRLMEAAA